MAIVILMIFIACAIMIYRRRKNKLIASHSVDTGTAGPGTNQSKADEMKQIQTEMQRQHLKQQNTDIEDIVKIQASKKTRRKQPQ